MPAQVGLVRIGRTEQAFAERLVGVFQVIRPIEQLHLRAHHDAVLLIYADQSFVPEAMKVGDQRQEVAEQIGAAVLSRRTWTTSCVTDTRSALIAQRWPYSFVMRLRPALLPTRSGVPGTR